MIGRLVPAKKEAFCNKCDARLQGRDALHAVRNLIGHQYDHWRDPERAESSWWGTKDQYLRTKCAKRDCGKEVAIHPRRGTMPHVNKAGTFCQGVGKFPKRRWMPSPSSREIAFMKAERRAAQLAEVNGQNK